MFIDANKLSVKPTQEEIYFLMESGYLANEMGRHQQASDIFLGVAALLPDDPTPVAAVGGVLLSAGQIEEAVGHLEKALKAFDEDPFLMAHLAEALLFHKENERAKQYFQKSVEKAPQGPAAEMAKSYLRLIAELEKR
jgi:tetratricopeptide (TPR) repeat protein